MDRMFTEDMFLKLYSRVPIAETRQESFLERMSQANTKLSYLNKFAFVFGYESQMLDFLDRSFRKKNKS